MTFEHINQWPARTGARGASIAAAVLVAVTALGGCMPTSTVQEADDSTEWPTQDELLSFYSPKGIRILPHTKVRSFDGDLFPDGIEVSLETLDGSGDSMKSFGVFQFELYEFRSAAGNRRGERLHYWRQPILSEADQREFWEHVTNTYQFHLSWEGRPLQPGRRYVLEAIYRASDRRRLTSSFEFEFRVDRREILEALSGSQN